MMHTITTGISQNEGTSLTLVSRRSGGVSNNAVINMRLSADLRANGHCAVSVRAFCRVSRIFLIEAGLLYT